MPGISGISGNVLQAFGASQQITAHNVANMNTDGFKAFRVTFQENGRGGVNTDVSATLDSVDISREATQLLLNKNGLYANLNVVQAADNMTKQLLSIKA